MEPSQADTHLTVVGILHVATGAMGVMAGIAVAIVFLGVSAPIREPAALLLLGGMGAVIGLLIVLFSIPAIAGGIALLQRRPWARIVLLVVGAFSLISIPIGTAIGIYTIWALTRPEVEARLASPA
jgi:hypothetical protein